jgi:predicted  nucleic acid-binding Zn-ribbon protein
MDEILERLSTAEKQLNGVKNKVALRDLQKMIRNIDSVVKEISRESVECRRLKKDTVRYNDLRASVVILLDNLDHHIIFAMLLS